jgi:hypothetical protein
LLELDLTEQAASFSVSLNNRASQTAASMTRQDLSDDVLHLIPRGMLQVLKRHLMLFSYDQLALKQYKQILVTRDTTNGRM